MYMNRWIRIKVLLFASLFVTAMVCASINPSTPFTNAGKKNKIHSEVFYQTQQSLPLIQISKQDTNGLNKLFKNFASYLFENIVSGILLLLLLSGCRTFLRNIQTFKSNKYLSTIVSKITLF